MTDVIVQDASDIVTPVEVTEVPQDVPAGRSLTVADAHVEVEAKWWGYQVHLNQAAVDFLDKILTILDEVLGKVLKGELKRAVALLIQAKQFRLKNVTQRTGNNGCQLVSPWICPVALTVVRERPQEDLSLYSAVWDPAANSWGEESAFTDIMSAAGPAVAQHGDRLYCVYRGTGSDMKLYWMVYTSKDGWSDEEPRAFPAHMTAGIPALVEFKGKLYCFHRGGNDTSLWYCTLNAAGDSWTQDVKINLDEISASGVTAAVLNDRLHLVYRCTGNKGWLNHISSTDGINWSSVNAVKNGSTHDTSADTPALAVYQDKLHLVHRGENDERLWHTNSADGGITWGTISHLPDHFSSQGPALAVHDGKLVMVHRSSAGNKKPDLWYATYNGTSWSGDTMFTNHHTGDNPGLVSYMDPNATTDNYVDANTVGPRLIVVYRGS